MINTAPFDKNCWPGKLDFDLMWLESITLMSWLSLAGFNVSKETILNLQNKEASPLKDGFIKNFVSPYLQAAFK